MTKASSPSGSLDEAIAFRQGISVVTIKDQLTGMLPKFSAGTRSRIVIDGNAPESDVYYDDSMIGLGPGSIVPAPAAVSPIFLYDHDFSKFNDLYDIASPGISNLLVSGSYTGELDATFRVQLANPDDADVYTISSPIFQPSPTSSMLDDMHVVVENITETTSEGEERVIVASGSYDSAQGINIYKVEIATAEEDAVDTIRWYKNDVLLTPEGSEEVITANDGNVLVDGTNRIVVKFDYDGFEDVRFGVPVKHTVGDYWVVVAGAQQIKWSKGEFDPESGATLDSITEKFQASAGPIGIMQTGYQLLTDGLYIKLPAQSGYPDGSDPNVPAMLWEFKVTSLKPEAAITAMQESSGKIQTYPDHRTEQRDFGQPKFHNDFDIAVKDQAQISTINVSRLPLIGEQSTISGARTTIGNTQLYDSPIHKKKRLSAAEANAVDQRAGIPVLDTDPLTRGWRQSTVSSDGSVGPYFTVRDLRDKSTRTRNNHFWFNHGNTTTTDVTLYDDKDPSPKASDPVAIDISGRDLTEIEFKGNKDLESLGTYSVYNIPAMLPLDAPAPGEDYWSIDAGKTMVSITDVHPGPMGATTSVNTSGETLYYLASDISKTYVLAAAVGWSPDIDEDDDPDVLPDKMSTDRIGNIIIDTVGTPTPLAKDQWMEYHGYIPASFTEVEWLQRNGYVAYQDVLHNKWFTIYDQDYQAYCVQFNVTDNIDSDAFIPVALTAADLQIDTNGDGILDKNKTKADPLFIKLNIDKHDTANDISGKLASRLQESIPLSLLEPAHPFYTGVDTSLVFTAKQNDTAASTTVITSRSFGRVQVSDIEPSLTDHGFQSWLTNVGSLGYAQNILDNDQVTTHQVGNCICLYNTTSYNYIAPLVSDFGHADLPFSVDASNMLWSNDNGITTYTLAEIDAAADTDGSGDISTAEAWAAGYIPYVGVDAFSPHVIWFNLEGTSRPPAGPSGLATDGITSLHGLWTYELDDDYYTDIKVAFELGNTLDAIVHFGSPGRTVSYFVDEAINTHTQFSIPFVSKTSSDIASLRILQRDPGPVTTFSTAIDDVSCHGVNSQAVVKNLRPGVQTAPDLRDRDYTCDSIVFAINDPVDVKERFFAEKRVIENYATFKINCVAEQKTGKLFDYTGQSWTDPDPDVLSSLAKDLKGGSVDLSNYEPNITEMFADIPQKEVSGQLIWRQTTSSTSEYTAEAAGFDLATPANNNYSSKNRVLWSDTISASIPVAPATTRTVTTAVEQNLEDDDMAAAGWFNFDSPGWEDITEIQWMTHENFIEVPAFTHKISQAAYFFLPHPDINFYVWFDVGQLSADPGDDGVLDDDIALDLDGISNISFNGGAVRVPLDSYSTAGTVAEQLTSRINSTRHDVKKVFVQVDVDDSSNPVYQAVTAGNISDYFTASINSEDSSIVDIVCKKPGLINTTVFSKNDSLNFPSTESGDEFSISLTDDGDTDFYVDITNIEPGFLLPPTTDVSNPDADTNLLVTVDDIPYSPAQPGLTKTVSEFLPYEDMNSMSRGYRKTLDDGTEVAVAGPVAYIEDDVGNLIYPVIMSNVSMKDPDQYDGVIEPLEIRSRASRNSPDGYFTAHDVKGQLQSDVSSDSRKRSNPITQFVNKGLTVFEPYEDGIEHMESSPAADAFTRTPVFNGIGTNDIAIIGKYSAAPGSGAEKYCIHCVTGYEASSSAPGDKFKWRKGDGDWSDNIELIPVDISGSIVSLSFDDLTAGTSSEYKTVHVPDGSYGYRINVFARGDINFSNEYYTLQYFDGTSWNELAKPDGTALDGVALSTIPTQINDMFHPNYSLIPHDGSGYTPGRHGYSVIPHWTYYIDTSDGMTEELPILSTGQIKFRVFTSLNVNNLAGVKNNLKVSFEFLRSAGSLELDNGLGAIFGNINGHTSGDEWEVEAISRSHQDSVGCLPLPGYLTWQESRIDPFVETTDMEEYSNKAVVLEPSLSQAVSNIAFVYPGYSGGLPSSTWETEYIRSLNGQAITVEDTAGKKLRLEFDDDGLLENSGDILVDLLRPETAYMRFPNVDGVFQKRNDEGNLLWEDPMGTASTFSAYSTAAPGERAQDFTDASGLALKNFDIDETTFAGLTEAQWAEGYSLSASIVTPTEITSILPDVNSYAGKYFIITDELNSRLEAPSPVTDHGGTEGINNTVIGGRYAVWFNVIDVELGTESTPPEFVGTAHVQSSVNLYWDPTLGGGGYYQVDDLPGYNPAAPDFHTEIQWTLDNGYYTTKIIKSATWSSDNGNTILCASPSGTGWDPDPDTQKMSTDSSGAQLWTPDSNVTVDTAAGFGLDDTVADDHASHPLANGYSLATLAEAIWHHREGYKNYSHLVPQLIQVDVNKEDSIEKLVKNTVKAIREYKNANQVNVFNCTYIHGPSYVDLHDLDPATDTDGDGTNDIDEYKALHPSEWRPADYDDVKHVRLESSWFNQYAYDPLSPGTKLALDSGWSRGHFTIKIESRNLGYHNISTRVHPDLNEPLYQDIQLAAGEIRDFEIVNSQASDWGGHHSFEDVLSITSSLINDAPVTITSEVLYSPSTGPKKTKCQLDADRSLYIQSDDLGTGLIVSNVEDDGFGGSRPQFEGFNSDSLIKDVFIRYPTQWLGSDIVVDAKPYNYFYIDFLCGLRLTQDIPGPSGNTEVKFHYYKDEYHGNIVTSDFTGGTTTGPHVDNMLLGMNPTTQQLLPHDHISAAAGMIYNEAPQGTDSITFGGWKK